VWPRTALRRRHPSWVSARRARTRAGSVQLTDFGTDVLWLQPGAGVRVQTRFPVAEEAHAHPCTSRPCSPPVPRTRFTPTHSERAGPTRHIGFYGRAVSRHRIPEKLWASVRPSMARERRSAASLARSRYRTHQARSKRWGLWARESVSPVGWLAPAAEIVPELADRAQQLSCHN
jgi:hypothetical protein